MLPTARTACLLALSASFAPAQTPCVRDVTFALEELERQAGHFFEQKGIRWQRVSKDIRKRAKKAKSLQEHYEVLLRLMAHLRDGHAVVMPAGEEPDVRWPEPEDLTGPGMFWCRVGKKVYVKNAFATAASNGVEAGMEVVKVDGLATDKWLRQRVDALREIRSFSTDHQAEFFAMHWGLAQPEGTRMKLVLRAGRGKTSNRTITYTKAATVPNGPAFYPPNLTHEDNVRFGRLESGFGYVHVRRCKAQLPAELDRALAAIGEVPGMILDFRGNSGGGFDHDAALGRFVPRGETLSFAKAIPSAGEHPYGGPVVVIVDATTRSAGETASGMFKEEGRAYMIGDSPTAGMSASKQELELPSKAFRLRFAVHSNKARWQRGRGIEGVGVEPHEELDYDPGDLAEGRDTLIRRAEELLERYPRNDVPYDPVKYGWTPPK